jgi:hypothetical protein
VSTLQIAASLILLSFPIPECVCDNPTAKTPEQAQELLNVHDFVFVGEVLDRKYRTIEPEYFGQNVHKLFIKFRVLQVFKGEVLEEVTIRTPVSAGCRPFQGASEYLVFASLENGAYRSKLCSGSKPITPDTSDELEYLNDATSSNSTLD